MDSNVIIFYSPKILYHLFQISLGFSLRSSSSYHFQSLFSSSSRQFIFLFNCFPVRSIPPWFLYISFLFQVCTKYGLLGIKDVGAISGHSALFNCLSIAEKWRSVEEKGLKHKVTVTLLLNIDGEATQVRIPSLCCPADNASLTMQCHLHSQPLERHDACNFIAIRTPVFVDEMGSHVHP